MLNIFLNVLSQDAIKLSITVHYVVGTLFTLILDIYVQNFLINVLESSSWFILLLSEVCLIYTTK